MSVNDAITARGLSQRIERALPTIQRNYLRQNALLYLAQKRNQIKWGGSHTEFEWYIARTTGTTPSFGGGELGVRTFEELNPVNRVHLPYCWIEETFGVSDKTLEANRHAAGRQKIYDSWKGNINVHVNLLYNRLTTAMWTGAEDGNGTGGEPVGLIWPVGNAYESTADVAVSQNCYYANQYLNSNAAIAAYTAQKGAAGWDDLHWAPIAVDLNECAGVTASDGATWAVDALYALSYVVDEMAVNQTLSGTGKPVKPDTAFMRPAEFAGVKNILLKSQLTYNVPVGMQDLLVAGFSNIRVDTLTCIKDTEVPLDSTHATGAGVARVFVVDSKEFHIATTHTKAEGLIKQETDTSSVVVSGAIGVLKANLGYYMSSPCAIGVIVGAN